jgi:hypothetical protein
MEVLGAQELNISKSKGKDMQISELETQPWPGDDVGEGILGKKSCCVPLPVEGA